MDIEQVIRRWSAGEAIRWIARATGLDRNTVRRLIRMAEQSGVRAGETVGDDVVTRIRQQSGQPGNTAQTQEAANRLQPYRERIQRGLLEDKLVLTKVHELLIREGVVISYSALYRFAHRFCGGPSVSVRRRDVEPGEVAEVDFGRLGLFQELGSNRPRVLWAFIMTLNHSR